jgi:hypothetical protein
MDNPRTMVAAVDLRIFDLDARAPVGDTIKAGTEIALVDKITDTDGKVYLRSKWSHDNKKNYGILANQVTDVKPTPPEPIPPKPIDTDPTKPGAGDVETRLNALERLVKAIADFLKAKFGFGG